MNHGNAALVVVLGLIIVGLVYGGKALLLRHSRRRTK